MRVRSWLSLLVIASACGSSAPISSVRFHNRPPAWKVDDRRPVSTAPEERREVTILDSFDSASYRRIMRALELPDPTPALDINSLGEVPDSTWFTNRIGRRDMSAEEVGRGSGGGPDLSRPLSIQKSLTGGTTPGFLVEDAGGLRFLAKLDDRQFPELASAANIITNRLLWACGYHVPGDTIGFVRRDQLRVGNEATFIDDFGRERSMREWDVDATLEAGWRRADGSYRILFSEYLPGQPLGGFPQEGVRSDDPNDTIPHQHRRSLRGLSLIAGWLQHTDMRERNTLDMLQEGPDGRYVVHYLVDFDKSLGVWGKTGPREEDGHTEPLDRHYFRSLLTFGLWKRPWESTRDPGLRGVGLLDAEHYRPGDWSPAVPYAPFLVADEHDMLWATRIVLRLGRAHIRAAVEAARLSDPRAVDYLTETLIARRDAAARYWLRRVNPLIDVAIEERAGMIRACFTDLERSSGLAARGAASRYRGAAHDERGRRLAGAAWVASAGEGRVCLPPLPLGGGPDGYTIVRIDTFRGQRARPALEVHVARDPRTRSPRIVGLER